MHHEAFDNRCQSFPFSDESKRKERRDNMEDQTKLDMNYREDQSKLLLFVELL